MIIDGGDGRWAVCLLARRGGTEHRTFASYSLIYWLLRAQCIFILGLRYAAHCGEIANTYGSSLCLRIDTSLHYSSISCNKALSQLCGLDFTNRSLGTLMRFRSGAAT